MVEEISWADATIDEEPQPFAEPQSNWDQAADFAMQALGGTQALGDVATGMLAWPVSKAAGGLVGPFVEGGPDMVEGFVGELMSNKPPEDPQARAGYDTIMEPVGKVMDVAFAPAEKVKEVVKHVTGSDGAAWSAGLIVELATFKAGHVAGKKLSAPMRARQARARKAAIRLSTKRAQAMDVDAQKAQVNKDLNTLNEFAKDHVDQPEVQKAISYLEGRDKIVDNMNRDMAIAEGDKLPQSPGLAERLEQRKLDAIDPDWPSQQGKGVNQILAQSKASGLTREEFLASRRQPIDPRQQQLNQLQQIRAAADRKIQSKSATDEEVRTAMAEKAEADQLLEGYGEISGQTGARPVDLGERSRLMDQIEVDPEPPPAMDPQPTRATELRARAAGVTPAEFLARRQAEMQGRQAPPVLDRRFVGEQDRGVRSIIEQSEPAEPVNVPMAELAAERQAVIEQQRQAKAVAEQQAAANELLMRRKDAQAQQLIEANDAAYRRNMSERLNKAITNRPLDDIIKDVGKIYNELLTEADTVSRVRVGEVLEQAGEVYEQAMSAKRRRDLPSTEAKPTATPKPAKTVAQRKAGMNRLKAAADRLNKRIGQGGSIDARTMSPETRAAIERTIVELRRQGKKISKFVSDQGFNRQMLVTMRQVAKEMDIDKRQLEKAEGTTGQVVKQRKLTSYEDPNTGETVDRFAPKVLDYQRAQIADLMDVETGQRGFEVTGRFLDRLGEFGVDLKERRRNEEGALSREKSKFKRDLKQVRKEAGRAGRKEAEVEQFKEQAGGPEIARNMGMEIPVLDIEIRSPKGAKAHKFIRDRYNELRDRVNKVRDKAGEKRMKDEPFFSHYMTDLESLGQNPLHMKAELLEDTLYNHKRTTTFNPAKRRIANQNNRTLLETDPFKVLDHYNDMALNYIHHAETLAWVHELVGDFKEPFKVEKINGLTGKLESKNYKGLKYANPKLYKALQAWKDHLAGVVPDSNIPPFWQKAMKALMGNVVVSTMSGNIASYLNQSAATIQANKALGNKFQAQGIYDLIRSAKPGSKLWQFMKENSNEMARRFGMFDVTFGEIMRPGALTRKAGKLGTALRGINKTKKAVGKAGMMPVAIVDYATAAATWFGAYRQGMKILKDSKRAVQWADDVVIRTQGSGSMSEISPVQRSPLGKFVTTLQTFAISNWNFLAKDVLGYKNPKMTSGDRFSAITRFMIGTTMLNYVFEDVMGVNSPMPNLISAAIDSVKNGDDPHEVALKIVIEATEVVPVLGSVSKFGGPLGGVVVQQLERALKFGDPMMVAEALARLAGIPGVSQMKKSARQIKQGGSTADVFTGGLYKPKKKSSGGRRSRRSRRRSR